MSREPDGWVSTATAFDLRHGRAVVTERLIWLESGPDHDVPIYIGATPAELSRIADTLAENERLKEELEEAYRQWPRSG